MTTPVTERLVEGILDLAQRPLPDAVAIAANRSLLNVVGTTIGASRHAAIDAITQVGTANGAAGNYPVPGRLERLGMLEAATAIGTAAHLDDFDDTHLRTVIHPGAATLGAVWTVGRRVAADGEQVHRAFALGIEAQLRIGNAMSPWHYDDGWHITGTCGPLGAAIAAGLLVGLDAPALCQALSVAASQTLGIREAFGTMMKPFHPGKAAANGVLAVLLVQEGFTSHPGVLEADNGFFTVLSPNGFDLDEVTNGLGTCWELEDNTFKPYPCGIVSHPSIDAAISLSAEAAHERITSVEATVHPLVTELTGDLTPRSGLEARFSTAHGIAVGLLDGRAGLAQYRDERVAAEDVTRVRENVRFSLATDSPRDAAELRVTLASGRVLEAVVEHARGSLERPLTDDELEAKVRDLVEPVLPGGSDGVITGVRDLPSMPSIDGLVAACTPEGGA